MEICKHISAFLQKWPRRPAVKTPGFHPGNRSSTLRGVTKKKHSPCVGVFSCASWEAGRRGVYSNNFLLRSCEGCKYTYNITMSNIEPEIDPLSIPGFVLWQAFKLWQRGLINALKPFHIGSTEFVVLGNAVRLSQLGQQATPVMLAEATKIDRMTASQTLRSLEKKGLIERAGMSEDKRTFHVAPTKAGVQLADDALGRVIQTHAVFFAPLHGNTEQFLKMMQGLIDGSSHERIVKDRDN